MCVWKEHVCFSPTKTFPKLNASFLGWYLWATFRRTALPSWLWLVQCSANGLLNSVISGSIHVLRSTFPLLLTLRDGLRPRVQPFALLLKYTNNLIPRMPFSSPLSPRVTYGDRSFRRQWLCRRSFHRIHFGEIESRRTDCRRSEQSTKLFSTKWTVDKMIVGQMIVGQRIGNFPLYSLTSTSTGGVAAYLYM